MLPGLMTETIDVLRGVGHWGHVLVARLSLFDRASLVRCLCATVVLGGSVFATPVAAQIGIEAVEGVLCQGEVGSIISSAITLAIGLWSGYFILKFLIRLMIGFDKAGRSDVHHRYLPLQIRDAFYSLIAALLPLFVGQFLSVAGIDIVSCVLPWLPV